MILRGLIQSVDDSTSLQLIKASLLAGEKPDEVERVQEYGLTSVPPENSETVVVQGGGASDNLICLKVDSAAHRVNDLSNGEVCVYSMHGQKIHLNGSGETIFNDGSNGVAREGHQTTSDTTIDSAFFAWVSAVSANLASLGKPVTSIPTTLTTQISQGSSKVKIND
jgi:phage baseplate assembly protein V